MVVFFLLISVFNTIVPQKQFLKNPVPWPPHPTILNLLLTNFTDGGPDQ